MLNDIETFLRRRYLFARQQFRHLQALSAYLARRSAGSGRQVSFVLFGRGRSGTTALVSMLDALPRVRCEGEVLHDYVPFPRIHVLGRRARCEQPVYGCKILSYQIRDVQKPRREPRQFLRRLHEVDGFKVLYLRRSNLVRHALSNIRARRETFHEKKSDPEKSRRPVPVDPDEVLDWIRSSERLNAYEQELLTDVPHLSLTYEEHIRDASSHQRTIDQICEFLGTVSAPVESSYRKVAPRSIREQVANYDELAEHLAHHSYAGHLD